MRTKNIFWIIFLSIILGFTAVCYYSFLKNSFNKEYFNPDKFQIESQVASQVSGYHYSFFSRKGFYDRAFEGLENSRIKNKGDIKGAIVNHHLLAPNLIAEVLSAVSSKEPITVVLISPNHFFAGRGQVISSLYDWQTPYGVLESDKNLIGKLRDARLVNIEEGPFEKEHGISNLVAFIKKTLPNARIVPLIVKDTFSFQAGDIFAENLNEVLPRNSLIIASLDFSHYLPSSAADFHDEKSLAVLSSLNYEGIKFLDIGSRPALRIFLKYLGLRGAEKFSLLNHSNSAKIVGDEKMSETTSYITGFFSSGGRKENKKVTLLAFGDLMLDRYVRKAMENNGDNYPFENIERFLGGNDITLVNLEGSFTDFQPKPLDSNNTTFTFKPSLVPVLKKLGFNMFNFANNHSLNFGKAGLIQSKNYLKNSTLDYFGDPLNDTDVSTVKEIRETKIGFVGFNEFSGSNFEKIITEIKKIKNETDFVVVFAHWGREYQANFSKSQQKKAHQFIDAGADTVLGSHSHVIQPIELYKGKFIFYSLGNFLFDQTFSSKTQQGLGVGVVFDKPEIDYYIFPVKTENFQIELIEKEESGIILRELANNSLISQNLKDQILQGKIGTEF
jgi:poly-gamma-glutamate synthesis protein (capsule biosynthesis protein)